jgi:hypothetical protein
MRHDTKPTPKSSNKMPRIERMGGAAALARTRGAQLRPREWESRSRDKQNGGGAQLVGRTSRVIRKVDAAWAAGRAARPNQREKAVQIAGRGRVDPSSMWPKSNLAANSLWLNIIMFTSCCLTRRKSATASVVQGTTIVRPQSVLADAGRIFPGRTVSPRRTTGPHGQACAGEIHNRFHKRGREFQQKIIWVLGSSRVQFDRGSNRRSLATRSRNITHVPQPITAATSD